MVVGWAGREGCSARDGELAEACNRGQQLRKSCVQPAESARINSLRPGLIPGRYDGNCLSASRTTAM